MKGSQENEKNCNIHYNIFNGNAIHHGVVEEAAPEAPAEEPAAEETPASDAATEVSTEDAGPDKAAIEAMLEPALVEYANSIGIDAKESDLKADTLAKVLEKRGL